MTLKVAINGFGRIGRSVFKAAFEKKNIEVVAINDLMDSVTIGHLLRFDTVYGKYPKEVQAQSDAIKVGGRKILVLNQKDPAFLPWKKLSVQVVFECTGIFKTRDACQGHLGAGAKHVILSAPAKDDTQILVLGTKKTDDILQKGCDSIVSNASCTTNSVAPVIQVLSDRFGVQKALMTTIHSYTAGQNLVDGPNKDLRRARSAAQNIVPTSTGAATATTRVIEGLDALFDGISIRVPTICASLSDITCLLRKNVTVEEVNTVFTQASRLKSYKNILGVTKEPLVSSDFIGDPRSSIVDLSFTRVVGGNLVKVLAWYDNEYAYSLRMVELAEALSKR